jgi:hypothetical protein
MTTTTTNELTNGRWLGQRGIFRHYVPDVDSIDLKEWPDEFAFHTMSTSVGGNVRGELIRCVAEGEVSYEARINGAEEHCGLSDIAAYSISSLAALAKGRQRPPLRMGADHRPTRRRHLERLMTGP